MPTLEELGQAVKKKYPGQYDDLADTDLATKVKTKYPGAYDDYTGSSTSATSQGNQGGGFGHFIQEAYQATPIAGWANALGSSFSDTGTQETRNEAARQAEKESEAREAFETNRPGRAILSGVESLPIIGPMAQGIEEKVQNKDWSGLAGTAAGTAATGAALGAAGTQTAADIGSVAKGAAKGGAKGGSEFVTYGMHRLPVPASVAGAMAGHFAGEMLGPVGAKVGGAVGFAAPIVKGAIKGGQEALQGIREGRRPIAPREPAAWQGIPEVQPPTPPDTSPIPSSLPSGRPFEDVLTERSSAAWQGIPEVQSPPTPQAPIPTPTQTLGGRTPGPIKLTRESSTPIWENSPPPVSSPGETPAPIPPAQVSLTGRKPGGLGSEAQVAAQAKPMPPPSPTEPPPVSGPGQPPSSTAGSTMPTPQELEGLSPKARAALLAEAKAHGAFRTARAKLIVDEARKANKDLGKMSVAERDAYARTIGSKRPLKGGTDELLMEEWAKPQRMAGGEPQFARGGVVKPKAGGSVEDRVRGSANVPLSPEGVQEATQLGQNLARKGFGRRGDTITPGVLDRAQQTAQHIAQFAPHARMMKPDPTLDTWRLGAIEGQPTEAVKGQIEDLIKNPDKVPPPGQISSEPPESFNSFKNRYLPPWKARIEAYMRQPNAKQVYISHGRGTRLIHGWVAKGMPDSLDVDPSYVLAENDKPGDVHRIAPGTGGRIRINEVHPEQQSGRLRQGIYLVRHAKTVFNADSKGDKTKASWHQGGVAIPHVAPPS